MFRIRSSIFRSLQARSLGLTPAHGGRLNRTGAIMEIQLSLEFLRVVEQAAIAAARTMGQGDRHKADDVAVEAMRGVMDTVPMDGTIVIGEGERDEAPMLFIGEKVGAAQHNKG